MRYPSRASVRSGFSEYGAMPIRRDRSSMMRHSWRASPRGGTTASVTCMNGVLKKPMNATGTSSRSRKVVAGST